MRSLSGTRNRVVLVLAGVIALLAAAWLLTVSFGVTLPGHTEPVVDLAGDTTLAEFAATQRDWLLPTAAVVTVLAVLIGLLLLLGQIPSRPSSSTLRFHRDGTLLGTVEPRVLERALAERLDQLAGIEDADLDVSGSTEALCVQGTVTAAAESELEWSVGEARRRLAADVQAGTDPHGGGVESDLPDGGDGVGGRARPGPVDEIGAQHPGPHPAGGEQDEGHEDDGDRAGGATDQTPCRRT